MPAISEYENLLTELRTVQNENEFLRRELAARELENNELWKENIDLKAREYKPNKHIINKELQGVKQRNYENSPTNPSF